MYGIIDRSSLLRAGKIGAFAAITLFAAPGCVIVKSQGDSSFPVKFGFGVVKVQIDNASTNSAASIAGVGAVISPYGLSLGYSELDMVSIRDPSDCFVAVFDADPETIEFIQFSLGRGNARPDAHCLGFKEDSHVKQSRS